MAAASLIALGALVVGCAPKHGAQPSVVIETPPDLNALYREIQALEFIHGLHLTPAQATELVKALEPFENQLTEANSQRHAAEQELVQLLQQRKVTLIQGKDVGAEIKARILDLRKSLTPQDRLSAQQESDLAGAVRSVLTAEQIAAMPASLDARAQAQDMLDGFRDLSPDDFESQIRPFAQDLVAQTPNVPADQVEALFREARSLSDTEYQDSLPKLVDQLTPMFTPSEEATDWLLADAFTQEGLLDLLRQIGRG